MGDLHAFILALLFTPGIAPSETRLAGNVWCTKTVEVAGAHLHGNEVQFQIQMTVNRFSPTWMFGETRP